MFLLAHVRSRDGAHDQENAPMSPDPFPRERLGSGNETRKGLVTVEQARDLTAIDHLPVVVRCYTAKKCTVIKRAVLMYNCTRAVYVIATGPFMPHV